MRPLGAVQRLRARVKRDALPPMPEEEIERRLAAYQAGAQWAVEPVLRSFMPWALNRALRARRLAWRDGHPCDVDDLYQVALIGVARAARTFRPSARARFMTYATIHIRANLQRFLNNNWSMVHTPVKYAGEVRRWQDRLVHDPGRLGDAARAAAASGRMLNLHLPAPGAEEELLVETIPAGGPSAEELLGEVRERARAPLVVRGLLQRVAPRRQRVVLHRLVEGFPRLDRVGERLGTTREAVRVLELHALDALALAAGSKRPVEAIAADYHALRRTERELGSLPPAPPEEVVALPADAPRLPSGRSGKFFCLRLMRKVKGRECLRFQAGQGVPGEATDFCASGACRQGCAVAEHLATPRRQHVA